MDMNMNIPTCNPHKKKVLLWGPDAEISLEEVNQLILNPIKLANQGPVVRRVDNFIQRINPYPTDKIGTF